MFLFFYERVLPDEVSITLTLTNIKRNINEGKLVHLIKDNHVYEYLPGEPENASQVRRIKHQEIHHRFE